MGRQLLPRHTACHFCGYTQTTTPHFLLLVFERWRRHPACHFCGYTKAPTLLFHLVVLEGWHCHSESPCERLLQLRERIARIAGAQYSLAPQGIARPCHSPVVARS